MSLKSPVGIIGSVVCASVLFLASTHLSTLSASSSNSDKARIQALEQELAQLKAELKKNQPIEVAQTSLASRVAVLENKTQYIQKNSHGDGATRIKSPFSDCGFIIHGDGNFQRVNMYNGSGC